VSFLLLLAPVAAQPDEDRKSEMVAAGIEHVEIRRGDFSVESNANRWMIHALIIDPQRARLRLAQAMDEVAGAETTSSMAARHGAIAAVNGGYFRTTGAAKGEPVGMLSIAGKLLSEPVKQRAALAVADNGNNLRVAIARVDLKSELRLNGKPGFAIGGFNRPREAGELIVFTPEFHRTTLTGPDGVEAIVKGNRVVAVFDGAGSQPIPPEGLVLSAAGEARQWALEHLKRGARVEIKTTIEADPAIPFRPDYILGGGPRLLNAGAFVAAEEAANYSDSLFRLRHPRTAIGWRADGKLILATVDGRQKTSVGMTIEELAALMRDLGCVEAMNLDGGGSTTMVVRSKIVNRPSDPTGERAVSDALLVFARGNDLKR
jgi:exopolysaccharide biosynthesis protein